MLGKKVQDVGDAKADKLDWCYIRSDGDQDAWEIDYFRWKNAVLDISVPLDKPLTAKQKMETLFQ